ncbi:MAG: pyridoxal 5'-phosphate synthase glutaminase subunit PdxT [Halobacteriota archaeon]|nr:pyridoxal 5'-phosphate synthase glutaminase subunit PdxT [Halobacteriota archaeon]
MRIGVIAIQGNVSEHVDALKRVFKERGEEGEAIEIKRSGLIPGCDGIVIPGGESTTLSRLIEREGMRSEILEASESGVPILGTCAGLILLAKDGDEEVKKTKQSLLKLMDIRVKRNAFGRQRESFEVLLETSIFIEPFRAPFIRAPAIVKAERGVEVIARFEDYIVAAKENKLLALAFHPELTEDTRFHHYFLDMV